MRLLTEAQRPLLHLEHNFVPAWRGSSRDGRIALLVYLCVCLGMIRITPMWLVVLTQHIMHGYVFLGQCLLSSVDLSAVMQVDRLLHVDD